MEGKAENGPSASASVTRTAWLVSFVVPMVLIGLLLAVEPSHAAPTPLAGASSLEEEAEAQAESEGEGEASEDEECLEAEGEFAAGELSKEERDEYCEGEDQGSAATKAGLLPEECLLRTFRPQAVANDSQDKLKLTIGYTTHEPADATVEIRNGGRTIDSSRRHLGRSGVIRLVEPLSDAEMDRVQAAGRFTVRLHVADAPDSCRRFETEQLTVKRTPKAGASDRGRDRRR